MIYLLILLAIKAVLLIWVILNAGIGLVPDEAQYWTWSQQLDWGYYSKPPGIAWQIWLGTQFFGNTELGVRSTAVVIGFILPILVYLLAKACRLKPATCFWAGATMALVPMGILASFLTITDGGMMLFWTASCAYLAYSLEHSKTPNFALLGLLILCGALFKWPIYFLWIFVVLWFPNRKIIGGIAISLLALLPTIFWNSTHDWVTFKHVGTTMIGGHPKEIGTVPVPHGNFWDFLGSQAALLSPIVFLILLAAFGTLLWKRNQLRSSLLFCGILSFCILAMACIISLFMKMQGNWCLFAYPTAIVFLCWYACERVQGKVILGIGLALSVVLCAFAFSIPYIQSHHVLSRYPIPYRYNSFRHNLGWDQLNQELTAMGYDPSKDFLFGDKYQMSSILSFYGPGQKRAYFLNMQGTRKNQFSFWPGMPEEQVGKDGFFVLAENIPHLTQQLPKQVEEYQQKLSKYFQEVHYLGTRPLFNANGEMAKGALFFKGIHYNGNSPLDPNKY